MPHTPASQTFSIEKFKNGLGETRFRFVTDSILRPGETCRSLRCWKTAAAARAAAKADNLSPTRRITGRKSERIRPEDTVRPDRAF